IYGVYFNNRRYPLSLPAFRQALAYLIDRPQVTQIADPTNVPDKVPTALLPPVAQQWLSRSDLAHLNPYTHNPAKAAALLKGLGFGPTVTLNGFGTVNLATFLKQMSATNDKATLSKAVKALAQMENQQLPMLPVEVKRLQTFYSSRTYTNWPAPSDPLWSDVGGWANSALSLMMQKGYVTPK